MIQMETLNFAEEEPGVRPCLGVSWSHALADAAAMSAFIGAWASASQKRHAAAAAAADAAHASPATATAAAVPPPILPLSLSPSPPSPSHDRLAILQGARTDTPPFPDYRLDDDPRLASECLCVLTQVRCAVAADDSHLSGGRAELAG